MRFFDRAVVVLLGMWCVTALAAPTTRPVTQPATGPTAIPVANIQRNTPVDFEKEILPILSSNCMACHNKTKAKAGLVLETPDDMLKGGDDGPAIIPKRGGDSLLLLAAAHQKDLVMPPKDNKVAAVDLTPHQLGLIKLWIDQGATGTISAAADVKWQAVQESFAPSYAVTITADGQYAAFGRGNQLFIYHIPTRQIAAQLIDPAIGESANKTAAHRDLVRSLSFSPDGNLLASGAYREVKLWKRAKTAQKFAITAADPIRAMAAGADGKFIASAGDSGVIQISDGATGQRMKDFAGHSAPVLSMSFSPDGGKLASASADKTVRVWEIAGGKEIAHAAVPDMTAVTWISGGSQIASAAGRRILIWKMPEGAAKELVVAKELPSQEAVIRCMDATTAAPGQILVGCEDGSVRLWNAETAQAAVQMKHDAPVVAVAIRGDGKRMLSAGGKYARLWDEKGKMIAELKGSQQLKEKISTAERALAFATAETAYHKGAVAAADKENKAQADRSKKASDAQAAAQKTLDEKQKALKAATEAKTKAEAEKQAADKIAAATKAVTDAEAAVKTAQKPAGLAADELELVKRNVARATEAFASAQAALTAAEAEQKKREAAVPAAKQAFTDSGTAIKSLAFSVDGTSFATAGDDKLIQTWSAETGQPLETVGPLNAPAVSVAYAGANIVAAADRSLVAWPSRAQWTLDRKLPLSNQPAMLDVVNALDFSPDGTLLAAGGGVPTRGSEIRIWNIADGQLRNKFDEAHSDAIFSLKFSPDGKRLASGAADRFARVFDLEKNVLIKSLEGHSHHVLGVAWKRDGRTLATAGADNVIKVWDPITGEKRKNIEGWGKEVTSISFIGDTDQIIASCGDGRVRIVKENAQDVRAWAVSGDFVLSAAASTDGSIVVTGGQDGILRVWNGTSGAEISSYPDK